MSVLGVPGGCYGDRAAAFTPCLHSILQLKLETMRYGMLDDMIFFCRSHIAPPMFLCHLPSVVLNTDRMAHLSKAHLSNNELTQNVGSLTPALQFAPSHAQHMMCLDLLLIINLIPFSMRIYDDQSGLKSNRKKSSS